MPTNGFWKTGRFPFRSVFGILMLLFHRLRVLQVGIVPFTRNAYKLWISTFVNSADSSWGLRRTLTGHLNGMRFCTLGTSVQHILLASQICCGAYWKLAAHITELPIHHWIQRVLHWQPVGPRRLGRPKHRWDSKLEMYCRYQRLGRWEDTAQDFEVWKQQLNGFLDFCSQ